MAKPLILQVSSSFSRGFDAPCRLWHWIDAVRYVRSDAVRHARGVSWFRTGPSRDHT